MARQTRFNILPALAVIAVLALGLRLADFAGQAGLIKFSTAHAASEEMAEQDEPPPAEPMLAEDEPQAVDGEAPTPNAEDAKSSDKPAEREARGIDPSEYQFSASEIQLLQTLGKRRVELDKRERAIDEREALLEAAEISFSRKRKELEELKQEIRSYLKIHDEKQQAQIDSLVKTYQTMKPKDAARIFDTMELDVLLEIITRMKESAKAPIMAEMDTKRAQTVTIRLAEQGRLPGASMVGEEGQ